MKLTKTVAFTLFSAVSICGADFAYEGLVNRWSFNEAAGSAAGGSVFTDSVGGRPAVVVGVGATKSGTALTIPGSASQGQNNARVSNSVIAAYVDLPNGIISSKTDFTLEIWSSSVTAEDQTRLFDFGRMNIAGVGTGARPGEVTNGSAISPGTTSASDSLAFLPNLGTDIGNQQLEAKFNGGATITTRPALPAATGTEYHDVFVFEDGAGNFGGNGGRFSWYRDGSFAASIDLGFHLEDIADVNNWLGRAQWSGDHVANISFDEVRLYDRALSLSEISDSRLAGADADVPAPMVQADSATINPLQKVRLDVLTNDSGIIDPGTVMIQTQPTSGSVMPAADGSILYTNTSGASSSDTFTYVVGGAGGTSSPATVTINLTSNLRVPTLGLNVPGSPPPTAYQLEGAFGNLQIEQPVCMATPPGETERLFICEKTGRLKVIESVTAANPTATTFLDLPAYLATRGENVESPGEQGLLSVAFHPDYANNGYFYVFYSVDPVGSSATFERISRFTVRADDPNLADTGSELILIQQLDERSNHNGGDMHFGADGYLYISLGDEGSQNDSENNSQRITKDFFSAVLRIDVDKKPGNLEPNAHPNPSQSDPATDAIPRYETSPGSGVFEAAYSVPVDNPYVTTALGGPWDGSFNGVAITSGNLPFVRSEFWAVGFRNPWRMSFDPPTGELWIGDVGQGTREEVVIAENGGNYGWNYREGFIARPGSGTPPAGFSPLDPIYDYAHTNASGDSNFQGNSITGGFVYRGSRFSNLFGAYVFADYVSGHIWSLRKNGASPPVVERIAGEGGIVAFGKDPSNGDVLMADLSQNRILRLVGGTPDGSYPATLSETKLFADLTDLSPNPGLLPYTVNLPFWSDHARKSRFFSIPDPAARMTFSSDGAWTYPTGQIWVKHFDMPLVRSDPPQPGDPLTPSKRIETRLIVKTETGSYGVSYRWNEDGTEATLAPEEGEDFDIEITRNGAPYTQRWHIPSRSECLSCHTPQAGHSLSMNTRQFNLSHIINGMSGNQIDLLENAGYFTNSPESPNLLPHHLAPDDTTQTAEARVRSYLDVNCAYCHQPGGTANPSAWDGRAGITLDQTGIVNGDAVNNGGDSTNKLVVPGDPMHSVVYNRVALANGFTRMPPLGSNELDRKNIALLLEWINGPLTTRQDYSQWRLEKFMSLTSAEGNPGFDADSDGADNHAEYLAGTDPNQAGSIFKTTQSIDAGVWTMTFPTVPNRIVQVYTSDDLVDWDLWDVAGNSETPRNGNAVSLSGPAAAGRAFFRVEIQEN